MKRPLVVFDFDKTLTKGDTLLGYYALVNEKDLKFRLKRLMLFGAALCYKLGIIDNDKLKQLGVKLFLCGFGREWLEAKAREYANRIKLNQVYDQNFLSTPKESRMIVSASFEIYLEELFPDEKVIGSELVFSQGRAVGLKKNMFGEAKKKYLREEGIQYVDCLYTDSYSDLPLMEIAKKVLLVKKGEVIKKSTQKNR